MGTSTAVRSRRSAYLCIQVPIVQHLIGILHSPGMLVYCREALGLERIVISAFKEATQAVAG